MTPAAALWMLWPRRALIQDHSLRGMPRLLRVLSGLLELGMIAAANTHFSTMRCIR